MKIRIFLFWALLCTASASAQTGDLYFNKFSIGSGLSHKHVSCIAQDREGFIWIGTEEGLNRYDGCNFRIFKHDIRNTASLSASTVNAICVTRSGDMWVGTDRGVCLYDRGNENFIRFTADNDPRHLLNNLRVKTIFEDRAGTLWIGTFEGLIKLDVERRYINYYSFASRSSDKMANEVRAICQENENTLWLGTFDGLYRFNIDDNSSVRYEARRVIARDTYNNLIDALLMPDPPSGVLYVGSSSGLTVMDTHTGAMDFYRAEDGGLTDNDIHGLALYGDNTLLVGTADGLSAFDIPTGRFTNYNSSLLQDTSLPNQTIWCVCEDLTGNLWFGTDNGVAYLNKHRKKIELFHATTDKGGFVRNVVVFDMDIRGNGERWLATKDGIIRYDRDMRLIRHYEFGSGGLTHNVVKSVKIDSRGTVWAGTNDGLNYYDPRSDRFVRAGYSSEGSSLKYIYDIKEDSDGDIVVNVSSGICFITPEADPAGGIVSLDFRTALISELIESDNNDISCIFPDREGNVWIACNRGLVRYEKHLNRFTHYSADPDDPLSIVSNRIYSIYPDDRGSVWVGTSEGLCRLDAASGKFVRFGDDPDLSLAIRSVVHDDGNNLWLATVDKLIMFDYAGNSKIVCDMQRNFGINELTSNSFCFDGAGRIFLGCDGGFIYFEPSDIVIDSGRDPLVISSFVLQGKELVPGTSAAGVKLLDKNIRQTEHIRLRHNMNSFRIYFALLNYDSPRNNKYRYQLAGHDRERMTTDGQRNYAEYSNLPPGRYTFTVTGSNPDGVESGNAGTLTIRIAPPWWGSWWARSVYLLLAAVLAVFTYKFITMRLRLSSELEIEKFERLKMEELNQIRMRFFTNISHEFKTPLSLIMGPLEELSGNSADEKQSRQFALMKRNGERLLRLIEQIMDLRKYDNDAMTLELASGEYVSFAYQIYLYFSDHAKSRNIDYWFENDAGANIYMFFDSDKVEKMLFNVISNAFRFTPDGGSISVSVGQRERNGRLWVETTITDTGQGIGSEDLDRIFERFYKVDGPSFGHITGTGIGLCLTRDYAQQHEGSVTVSSKVGEGSSFTIALPCDLTCGDPSPAAEESAGGDGNTGSGEDGGIKILIVDDNDDMLDFMRLSLEDRYRIYAARNGYEGLEETKKVYPDVIITDIMMPVMDGFEFCRRVKEDILTCHIPVVILTAKKSESDRERGYASGADGFISKPFSISTLKTRIAAIISQSSKLRERYKYMLLMQDDGMVIESENDKFISEMLAIVERNLDNPDFEIQDLCDEAKYSYQQIYRKIRALTGKTINEFIRSVRLKHAAQYLTRGGMRVSEVIYTVGFNSHSYFTKCFKEHFGVSPREFVEKYKNEAGDRE